MISFDLPLAGDATIDVLNVLGEQVKKIASGYMGAGRHQVVFDGKGDSGESLPSGVYFYRLQSGDFAATRKMVLLEMKKDQVEKYRYDVHKFPWSKLRSFQCLRQCRQG